MHLIVTNTRDCDYQVLRRLYRETKWRDLKKLGGTTAAALHLDYLTPANSESQAQFLQEKCNPTAEDAVKDEQASTEVE